MFMPFFWRISIIRFLFNRKFKKVAGKIRAGKVLELGAGPISYKHLFHDCDVVSTDIKQYSGIDEIVDVHDLAYKDETFDYVVCVSVLEHVFETKKAVSEIYRVLKKDGVAIINTPFLYPLHDEPNDYFRFTEFAYRKLFDNFSRVEVDVTPILHFGIFKKFVLFYIVKAYK